MTTKKIEDFTLTIESSFYKSVHYIDNILGPIKDIICEVNSKNDHNNKYIVNREYAGYRAWKVYHCINAAFLAAA
ncbi:MAG: hypothetical protein ACR5K2_03535 [Wolbachia sp.]